MPPDKEYVPFSVRAGRRTVPQLGLEEMPSDLRISLWNVIEPWIFRWHYGEEYERRARWVYNFHAIRWPTSEIPERTYSSDATARVEGWFLDDASCDDILDFIEALPRMVFHGVHGEFMDFDELARRMTQLRDYVVLLLDSYQKDLNRMLEREGSPYRLIEFVLTPVTSELEISAVSEAAGGSDRFKIARDHIVEAMIHLGGRPPSYADSIKQSVSAIESGLSIAVGGDSWRMRKLLDEFESKYGAMHPSLRAAIDKLYGYASDEDGVRHGAKSEVTVGEPEARAMLVTCSALLNYLVRRASSS